VGILSSSFDWLTCLNGDELKRNLNTTYKVDQNMRQVIYKTGNVRMNVASRRVRLTIVAMEKE
jgi:hypothetical protein